MKQPGLKHYCKNCKVKRYWSLDYENIWCPKCDCVAPNKMRCKIPENFEPIYTIEDIREINHHK